MSNKDKIIPLSPMTYLEKADQGAYVKARLRREKRGIFITAVITVILIIAIIL